MKRVRRLSLVAAQASHFNVMCIWSNPKSILPSTTIAAAFTRRPINTLPNPNIPPVLISLFTDTPIAIDNLTPNATLLRNELVREASDSVSIRRILDDNSVSLIHFDSLFLDLLIQLDSYPSLLLQVFNWRRENMSESNAGSSNPMNAYEYSKGISVAGRTKNIDLAVKLFKEAAKMGVKTTGTYNALMGTYLFNGLTDRCYSLFLDMKKDPTCNPSIVTYNIVISVFSRLMLVDHMEAAFKEIHELHLVSNIQTYNCLITGYISTWKWDDMEKVFQMLKSGPLEPNFYTYSLMIRGYASSGNLVKMEETYSLVRDLVNEKHFSLIRAMIVAYCKSSEPDRVKKVEALLKLIPEEDYKPWLNVLLIKLYAEIDCLEEMEKAINMAFEHRTSVTTASIMNCIIAAYYRCNALQNLENFGRRAAISGWKICHSLYHCKMVMYGSQKNFKEMQNVLEEMNSFCMSANCRTLWIMYKAYLSSGQRSMVLKVLGQMFKHGYQIPSDAFPS